MLCLVIRHVRGAQAGRTWSSLAESAPEGGSSRCFRCGDEVCSAKGREKESDLSLMIKEKVMRGRGANLGSIGLNCSCSSVCSVSCCLLSHLNYFLGSKLNVTSLCIDIAHLFSFTFTHWLFLSRLLTGTY